MLTLRLTTDIFLNLYLTLFFMFFFGTAFEIIWDKFVINLLINYSLVLDSSGIHRARIWCK